MNRCYQALRQFGRWLQRNRRLPFDPFETLSPLNESEDRRHVRRALTPTVVEQLIRTARTRPLDDARKARIQSGVSPAEEERLAALGASRALPCAMALCTGLPRGELKALQWRDLDLALDGARVTVRASSAKARREQTVPLPADLVSALRAHSGTVALGDAVFPSRTFPLLSTFKRNLAAAGIIRRELIVVSPPCAKFKGRRDVYHTEDD